MTDDILTVSSGGVPYQTTVTAGAHTLLADEPVALGGTDVGPSPGALLLASLGTCTAITLRMYAARKQWPLAAVRVRLWFDVASKPDAATTAIRREIKLVGDLDDEQRARLLHLATACPMHKLLTNPVLVLTEPAA